MPSITIYGGRFGSSLRPHWMLAELGLDYETKNVELSKGEHRTPEFLALNPAGQVPVMVHDGFTLTESVAMTHFLAEKYGPQFFGPSTAESHATMLRWQLFTLLSVEKHFSLLAGKKFGRPAPAESEEAAVAALKASVKIVEDLFAKQAYAVGGDFTVADVVMYTSFTYAAYADFSLAEYPAIQAWMQRCSERPAYAKATQQA